MPWVMLHQIVPPGFPRRGAELFMRMHAYTIQHHLEASRHVTRIENRRTIVNSCQNRLGNVADGHEIAGLGFLVPHERLSIFILTRDRIAYSCKRLSYKNKMKPDTRKAP